jgi:hypothetical protein
MHIYKVKAARTGLVLPIVIFCAMLALFWYGFSVSTAENGTRDLQVTQAAVQKAVVNCYAIEGVYPSDVKYLEDHYGLVIDHEKYIVHYESIGSNVMPSVEVLKKGNG